MLPLGQPQGATAPSLRRVCWLATVLAIAVLLLLFLAVLGFPGEGFCPLQSHVRQVDSLIQRLGIHARSSDQLFRRLGDWAIDSQDDSPATARVQARPRQWEALLGATFPSRVARSGLSLHVERQPYQVRRPPQLPMPADAAKEVSRQVAAHLQRGYVEIVPTESDDHLPLSADAPEWERNTPVSVNDTSRWTNDGTVLLSRLRQTAAHARAGRVKGLHLSRRSGQPAFAQRKRGCQRQSARLLRQTTPADEPEILRGSRGYVRKVLLDYETQLFVVPKRQLGEWRMCQNLKFWNIDFSTRQHFKLEGAQAVAAMLRNGDWACTGDLSQAYHQCGIHPAFRRQLRFRWNGVRYQWRVLPFGLRLAPLYWTKLLRPVIARVRALGIRCLLYLDDLVVLGSSRLDAARNWAIVAGLMARVLGLLFAPNKTNTVPSQQFEALGFNWDCSDPTSPLCRYPERKRKALARMVTRLAAMQQRGAAVPLRLLARFLGVLESSKLACPWMRRWRGNAQWELRAGLRRHGGYDGKVKLSPAVRQDLLALHQRLQQDCSAQLQRPPASVTVTFGADAATSLQWGAWCRRRGVALPNGDVLPPIDIETNGPFTENEYQMSINVLEAIGQQQGLQALLPPVIERIPLAMRRRIDLHCVCDNSTTVHSNNKQRAKSSRLSLQRANATWDFLSKAGMDPLRWQTVHLAGVLNVRADRLSRQRFDPRDWTVAGYVFSYLQRRLRLRCGFDLFANRANARCPRFASATWDGEAEYVDAFSRPWAPLLQGQAVCYAHPPYILIPRVLRRVIEERVTLVLITPVWPSQPWWPLVLSLAVSVPVLIPEAAHALLPPGFPANQQTWPGRWRMIAWAISGDSSRCEGFRRRRGTDWSTLPNTQRRQATTNYRGGASSIGRLPMDTGILSQIQQGFHHLCW